MSKCTTIADKDAELHNIKSISRMNSFIKRLIISFSSINKTFLSMHDEILKLNNDLNFRRVDPQMIDSYNKMIIFMFDQVTGILSQTISGQKCSETLIIKPVNIDRDQYSHRLELTYFLPNMSCLTKPLGTITNVSSIKVNDHYKILRGENLYEFVLIDIDDVITVDSFREHLVTYEAKIKELIAWFYTDMDYVKLAFRALLDILSDSIKLSKCSHQQKRWKILVKRIKLNSSVIYKCVNNM
jgi:hypothetical protein